MPSHNAQHQNIFMRFFLFAVFVPLLLAGCATPSATSVSAPAAAAPAAEDSGREAADAIPPVSCPAGTPLAGAPEAPAGTAPDARPRGRLVASRFAAMPRWRQGLTPAAWRAFLQSCTALATRAPWQEPCADAARLPDPPSAAAMQAFFEGHFTPWLVENPDGSNTGLVTGYYEPLLHGSLTRSARYRYPVYAPPPDLLTVDLGELVPELKGRPVRGRLDGHRVVPYFTRAEIDGAQAPPAGQALAWVDDPVDLFFLQIQGSGRIALEQGGALRVGYADQNGHPFRSIGRLLVQRGDLTLAQASLQGIKAWATAHPDAVTALLDANPSYVFFRVLPDGLPGPIGALGVPITGGASLAVDPRVIPLGAPVFLDTTEPNSRRPLRRLMLAQDTGGAIHGAVRADFFWGYGSGAERNAGAMKQAGRLWVLYPRAATPPEPR